jgi:hypothetical protein
LLLVTLMFWQGGFMFYGAIVVPVGSEVLGSHLTQGFITRAVTNYLNLAGAVALAVWCWDVAAERTSTRRRRRLRWLVWSLLVVLLGVLAWLHLRLDEFLDTDSFRVLDQSGYHRLHERYLLISTVQWAGAIFLAALTILAWREADVVHPHGAETGEMRKHARTEPVAHEDDSDSTAP